MPNASIGGLVSGLDTATIINQLMQIEAISQTRLKERASDKELELNSLQTLNAKLASLATKAEGLTKADAWAPLTATSSSEHVTGTVGTDAVTGSLTFTVDRVATAHRVTFQNTVADTSTVIATPGSKLTVDLLDGSAPVQIDVGDGTLDAVVSAINKAGAGVQAVAVRTDSGYRLSVHATTTGVSSDFTITGIQLGATTATSGVDAAIRIGSDTLSSSTNTFTDVLTGLDLTITPDAVGKTVDMTVTRDEQTMAESVKALVDSVNAALADITSLTSYETPERSGGLLAGDSGLRMLRDRLVSSVTSGFGGKSLAVAGIEVDRSGNLTFDEETFKSAYAADPVGTQALFTGADGFATRIEEIADGASDSIDGTITLAIKGHTATIDRLEDDIADWDVRLGLRREALTRQYAALEVSLGQLQSQSSWLAGQIASLPQISTGQ